MGDSVRGHSTQKLLWQGCELVRGFGTLAQWAGSVTPEESKPHGWTRAWGRYTEDFPGLGLGLGWGSPGEGVS